MTANDRNLSTEYQPKGAAANPSDTLDRRNEHVTPGQRQWADDSAERPDDAEGDQLQNASVRKGGQAIGGVAPQPGDPTDPASADARAAERDAEQAHHGHGDDGARSTYRS